MQKKILLKKYHKNARNLVNKKFIFLSLKQNKYKKPNFQNIGLFTSIVYIILLHKMYFSNTKILQKYNITNITYNSIVLHKMLMFQIDVGSGYCAMNGILSLESSLLSDILPSLLMSY